MTTAAGLAALALGVPRTRDGSRGEAWATTSRPPSRTYWLIRPSRNAILRGRFTLDVKTGDATLDEELLGRWYEWSDDPICDIQGEQNFHGLATSSSSRPSWKR